MPSQHHLNIIWISQESASDQWSNTKGHAGREDSILFFAAAANDGANKEEMFPANHDSVISIRAANSEGAFADFNPPRNPDEPVVYGTLGKDVPSAWLRGHSSEACKTGTSVATPE
jgi:hypothetical protein